MRFVSLVLALLVGGCGTASPAASSSTVPTPSTDNAPRDVRAGMVLVWGATDSESFVRDRRPGDAPPTVTFVDRVAIGDLDGDGHADAIARLTDGEVEHGMSYAVLLRRGERLVVAETGSDARMSTGVMQVTDLHITDRRVLRSSTLCPDECSCVPASRCCTEVDEVFVWDDGLSILDDLTQMSEPDPEC